MSHEIEPNSGAETQSQWRNFFNYYELGPRQFGINVATVLSAAWIVAYGVGSAFVMADYGEDRGDVNKPKIHGEPIKTRTLSNEKFDSIDAYAKKVGTEIVKCLERSDETLQGDPVPKDGMLLRSGGHGCFDGWTAGKLDVVFRPDEADGTAELTIRNNYTYGEPVAGVLPDFDVYTVRLQGPYVDDDGVLKKNDALTFLARPTTHVVSTGIEEYTEVSVTRAQVQVKQAEDHTGFAVSSTATSTGSNKDGGTETDTFRGRPVYDLCSSIDRVAEDAFLGESVVCNRAG